MLSQPQHYRDLIHLLEYRAMLSPDKPVYSFLDRRLDCVHSFCYGEFFEKVRVLAAQLQCAGVSRTPVVLLQPDAREFVLSFWACILAGAWPMPYARPHGYRWSHLVALLKQSGASALLTNAAMAKLLACEPLADIKLVIPDQHPHADGDGHMPWIRPSIHHDDVAFIQYTSGSTSRDRKSVV